MNRKIEPGRNKIHCPELDNLFNWDRLYPINPKNIKWALITNSWFDVCKNEWSKVYDGDWDERLEIEKDFVYSSIHDMFKNNVPFKQTSLYLKTKEQIENGQNRWGCKNVQDLNWREGWLRNLFASVKVYGFKTQDELENEGYITVKLNNKNVDDPGVIIDRDGRLMYHNGNHRLPMFQIIGVPEIKIKINVRHKKWVNFVQYVDAICSSMWGKNKSYQPIKHLDFSNYTSEWSDYRFNLINQFIDKNENKTLLDIGALFGYFSSEFEREGLDCTAIEQNLPFSYIMDKLRISNDQNFKIIKSSIFTIDNFNYDVVLALNIFHHFLKSEESFNNLSTFLRKLNIKEMFFQSHQVSEQQMDGAYKNFQPVEFVEFIIANSCLTNYVEIGEELGRKIYKLWR